MGFFCSSLLFAIFLIIIPTWAKYLDESSAVFRYHNSFRLPFGGTNLPYWETGGSTVITESGVRITDGRPNEFGWIRGQRYIRDSNWEMRMTFCMGSSSSVGSDGMALWITPHRKLTEGPIYGMSEVWKGLLIVFDTMFHDNNRQKQDSRIYAIYNDGTLHYDGDWLRHSIATCIAPFRQTGAAIESITIVINYKDGILHLDYDPPQDHKTVGVPCFSKKIDLSEMGRYFFITISATTGNLYPDMQEVQEFLTWTENDKDKIQSDKKSKKNRENREPIQEFHDATDSDNSPPEDNNSPPEDNNSPPDDNNSPPDDNNSPPDDNNYPPEDNNSPPEDNNSPPDDNNYPPEDNLNQPPLEKEVSPQDLNAIPPEDLPPPQGTNQPSPTVRDTKKPNVVVKNIRAGSQKPPPPTQQPPQNEQQQPPPTQQPPQNEQQQPPTQQPPQNEQQQSPPTQQPPQNEQQQPPTQQPPQNEQQQSPPTQQPPQNEQQQSPPTQQPPQNEQQQPPTQQPPQNEQQQSPPTQQPPQNEQQQPPTQQPPQNEQQPPPTQQPPQNEQQPPPTQQTPQNEQQQPPPTQQPPQNEQQQPSPPPQQPPLEVQQQKRRALSLEEANEISKRIYELQKKRMSSSYTANKQITGLQAKLDHLEHNWRVSANSIEKGFSSFRGSEGVGSDTVSSMRSTLTSIASISRLMEGLEQKMRWADANTDQLHEEHTRKMAELAVLLEGGAGGWGYWVYLLIVQIILGMVFVWFYKRKEEVSLGI